MADASYAEVVYETGDAAVVKVDNLDDLKEALKVQHNRAKTGQSSGPQNRPAERVAKVLLYDEHPGGNGVGTTLDANALTQVINGLNQGGQVSLAELQNQLAVEASSIKPIDPQNPNRLESKYKAKELSELSLDFLEEK